MTFQKPDIKEDTVFDKLLRKGKNFVNEDKDTGDIVNLLTEQNELLKVLDKRQEFKLLNTVKQIRTFQTLEVGTPKLIFPFIKNLSSGYYIKIINLTISSKKPINFILTNINSESSEKNYNGISESNFELTNIRSEVNRNIDLSIQNFVDYGISIKVSTYCIYQFIKDVIERV